MSGFLKLRCDRAYATGALRTALSNAEFAKKLKRFGVRAHTEGDMVVIEDGGDVLRFGDWESNGLERTGWLSFTTADVFTLSRRLAEAGIPHRLEWSRPAEVDITDVRCVTSFDYRWSRPHPLAGAKKPDIDTYDEALPAVV
jgi:hypothetical protein